MRRADVVFVFLIIHKSHVLYSVVLAQEVLETFDKQIQGVCLHVNDIMDEIQEHVPHWQFNVADKSIVMDTS